ncbi:unnamed protein product [Arctia plantaginis]|uniref:Uncharacterized protein n=1 Tax=Arctia plantaginis TaxID=874455 RepID=A0A8S0ZRG9_ARCPL|nr:unnamed protein product [Arctia plantaginis]
MGIPGALCEGQPQQHLTLHRKQACLCVCEPLLQAFYLNCEVVLLLHRGKRTSLPCLQCVPRAPESQPLD